MNNTNSQPTPWDIVYTYTRATAVADGIQVEVSKLAAEAGRPVIPVPFGIRDCCWRYPLPARG